MYVWAAPARAAHLQALMILIVLSAVMFHPLVVGSRHPFVAAMIISRVTVASAALARVVRLLQRTSLTAQVAAMSAALGRRHPTAAALII